MKIAQEVRIAPSLKDTNLVHSDVEVKFPGTEIEPSDGFDGDKHQLARLGKKQVLQVLFLV